MKLNKKNQRRKGWSKLLLFAFIFSLSFSIQAQSQQINVSGTVTNSEDGLPIPGVAVIVKGTSNGAVTDFDGLFSIRTKLGDQLYVSYLGMESKTVEVTGTEMNISLSPSLEDLEEVVVIGYGTVKKKEVTGAVSSVKAEDIEQIVTSDLGIALQGQMPGVNVISSPEPGAPSQILIRGITSVAGDSEPLYVVDGLIQEGNPLISPNEIQSIDVLKDAASTAIYGTRGAAGVILITTKQGQAGSLSVRANSNYGIKRLDRTAVRLMNANQQTYFDLIARRNVSGGLGDDEIDIIGLGGASRLQLNTNLFNNVVIDDQPTQNHFVSISGGSKDITYSVSTGFFQEKGSQVGASFDRFNIRANTNYKHGKWDIRANISLNSERREFTPGGLINQLIRYRPYNQDLTTLEPDEVVVNLGGENGNRANFVLNSFENERHQDVVRTQTNININYDIFEGMRLTGRYGLSTNNLFERRFNPFRQVLQINGGNVDWSPPSSSNVRNDAARTKNQSFDLYGTYKFNIEDIHDFTFTAGMTWEDYHTERFFAQRDGVLNNSIKTLNGTSENPQVGSGRDREHTILGVIARIQYGYKGRYLLSSSVRRDASSRFGKNNRSNIFPSAAFAWNVSDEKFWSHTKNVINSLKFRLSYGEVGNESFGDYAFDASITPNIDYVFGSGTGDLANGAIQTGFANPNVKWETSIQKNIGVDIGLFKNRLTLAAEYYDKTNEDMLFPIGITPSASGLRNATVVLNIGNMTNKGFEFAARYRPNLGKLKMTLGGTFTTNENKITRIEGNKEPIYNIDFGLRGTPITVLAEGYEAGAFFMHTTDGIIKTQEELDEYSLLDTDIEPQLGDVRFVDNNGDGAITNADRVYSGSGLPEYEIGFNLNADYKGFDLSMNWYAALGQELVNSARYEAFAQGRHEDLVYQWSESNPTSNIPSSRGPEHINYQGFSDLWVEDGSYIRLRQATLGYSFSKKFLDKIGGMNKLRLYVSAQNPLTITDYKGYDPEVGGNTVRRGIDRDQYPRTALYLVGLDLNF
ncbi:SusC/RagA family TonB-linked outer membrane protein [Flavivirga algicola]|uniref:TonB-dependent receptor n=1 Tax=Flavivirga algicola TaxID=2729136 RepID=A0ABX1RTI9_9FLAO|nr:TonB-dependent receptor [Flavivirga algicola]NMH86866.1 TonB-dependent receptor [Flavivirga algicola]